MPPSKHAPVQARGCSIGHQAAGHCAHCSLFYGNGTLTCVVGGGKYERGVSVTGAVSSSEVSCMFGAGCFSVK